MCLRKSIINNDFSILRKFLSESIVVYCLAVMKPCVFEHHNLTWLHLRNMLSNFRPNTIIKLYHLSF